MSRKSRHRGPKAADRRARAAEPPGRDTGGPETGDAGLFPVRRLAPVLVTLVTLATFLPALKGEFLAWDDGATFLDNPHYRGLGPANLKWMWTTFYLALYRPLTWMSFGADYLLWGMDPFGYHVTSLLLHGANALVFYFLCLRILGLAVRRGREGEHAVLSVAAAVAALLFAVHPLRAEPVAWASDRGDLLSGLFLLLSTLGYLRSCQEPDHGPARRLWLAVAVGLFGMSLLSKTTVVAYPLILIALDVYPLRRLGAGPGGWFGRRVRGVWWEKVPFFASAAAVAAIGFFSKAGNIALIRFEGDRLVPMIALPAFAVTFHLWKTLVPLALSPLYELPPVLVLSDWRFLLSGTVAVAISVVLIVRRRRWPGGLAAWVCYVAMLVPTSGIVVYGSQMAADRYTYLSCLGWAVLAGAGFFSLWRAYANPRFGASARVLIAGLTVSLIAGLGALTWKQVHVWHDSETLWSHAVSVDPRSSFAHNNLGVVLDRKGRPDEARGHFQEALRLRPDDALAHDNLGFVLARQGRLAAAIEHYRQAVTLHPAFAEAHFHLGTALLQQGKLSEAAEHYQQALEIRPAHAEAHNNLGVLLLRQGKPREALEQFERAARINPFLQGVRQNIDAATARLNR